jgi:hypothetical protein
MDDFALSEARVNGGYYTARPQHRTYQFEIAGAVHGDDGDAVASLQSMLDQSTGYRLDAIVKRGPCNRLLGGD